MIREVDKTARAADTGLKAALRVAEGLGMLESMF